MRKKTFLSIIVAIGICVSMTGCGSTSNGAADALSSKEGKVKELKATDEILEADIYSQKIQFGNTVLTLPITLEEVIARGDVVNHKEVKPTDMINTSAYYTGIELNFDGWNYRLSFIRKAEPVDGSVPNIPLKECTMDALQDFEQEVIMPKGIKIGMSLSELKNAWGEPTNYSESYPDSYIYKKNQNSDNYILFKINLETETIDSISGRFYE